MISTESRSQKPYALPVQCLSYLGMIVKQMRGILNRLLVAMVERNMDENGELMGISIYSIVHVCIMIGVGFVSNGEYNSMRAQGYSQPLSVLQIRADTRRKYSSMGKKTMIDMLTPKRKIKLHYNVIHVHVHVSLYKVYSEKFTYRRLGNFCC